MGMRMCCALAVATIVLSPIGAIHGSEQLTTSQSELVVWATARFRAAGLDVPPVTVAFTPDHQHCAGFVGLYRPAVHTVNMCADEHASDLVLRRLLLHEMAHAWTDLHVTGEARVGFVRLRGTPSWDSVRDVWVQRASEHAAEVIAWGLMDIEAAVMPVGDTSPNALERAFRFLTGVDPVNDGSLPSPHPTQPPAVPTVRLS
jgi:hypothetical protein